MTNATTTQQPRIVASGTISTDVNGYPHAEFDGTNDLLSVSVSLALPITMFGVVKADAITDEDGFYSGGGTTRQAVRANDTVTDEFKLTNGGTLADPSWSLSQVVIETQCVTGTTDTIRVNAGTQVSGSAGDNAMTAILVGEGTLVLDYNFSELVISADFNLASDEATIRNNINAYYTIY